MYGKPTQNYNTVDIMLWFFDFNYHFSPPGGRSLVMEGRGTPEFSRERKKFKKQAILYREDDEQGIKYAYLKLRDVQLGSISRRTTRTTTHDFGNLLHSPVIVFTSNYFVVLANAS